MVFILSANKDKRKQVDIGSNASESTLSDTNTKKQQYNNKH